MKKRYLYSILFGIPGLLLSGLFALLIAGFAAGVLWIFVFGDNPWPSIVETALPVLIALVFLTVWIAFTAIGFVIGKRLESDPILNKKHILASIIATLLPILFFLFYQLSVGNVGPESAGIRCDDYCLKQGYSASSVSPQNAGSQTCSCLDSLGREKLKVPLDTLKSPK